MSFLPYDPDLGYAPESDDPIGLGNLAARQHGQAESSAAWRSQAKCRRCGATECSYCHAAVPTEPGNMTAALCHSCHADAYGGTEIDLQTMAPVATVPSCRRLSAAV